MNDTHTRTLRATSAEIPHIQPWNGRIGPQDNRSEGDRRLHALVGDLCRSRWSLANCLPGFARGFGRADWMSLIAWLKADIERGRGSFRQIVRLRILRVAGEG